MDITLQRVFELIGKKHGAKKELADFLQISSNNITDWKSGKNKSYRLYVDKIAEYYNVSSDWIYGKTDEKKPALETENGLSEKDIEFMRIVRGLSTEHQQQILEIAKILRGKS